MKTFTEWFKERGNLSEAIADEFPKLVNQALKMMIELRGPDVNFKAGPVNKKDLRTGTTMISRTIEDLKNVMQNLGNYAVPRPRDLVILKAAANLISTWYQPKEIGQEFAQRVSNVLGIETMKPIPPLNTLFQRSLFTRAKNLIGL